MQTRVRVFREGQLVLDGNPKPFVPDSKNAGGKFTVFGAVSIGSEMEPGDYVLQVIVTDIAMSKAQTQSQYIQFEVVP